MPAHVNNTRRGIEGLAATIRMVNMGDRTARLFSIFTVLGVLLSGIALGVEVDHATVDSPASAATTDPQTLPPANPQSPASEALPPSTDVTASPQPRQHKTIPLDKFYQAIQSEQALSPYNPTLSESFYNLGLALQHNQQHQEALDNLRRALHIIRINSGIYSLAQSPVLRAIIDSHRALNRVEDTTADYHHLFWLHVKSFGENDPRLIPVLNELSHWHLSAYTLDPDDAAFDHLATSHSLNSAALGLAEAAPYTTRVELLRTQALTSFFLAGHEGDDWRSAYDSRFRFNTEPLNAGLPARGEVLTSSSYRNGRVAYEEIIAILEQQPTATAEEKIRAYTELGDWYLLFNRRESALATYAQALNLARQMPAPENVTNQFFSAPQLLPAIWVDGAAAVDVANPATSYVEARLDVSKTGTPSNVEVVASLPKDDVILRRTVRSRLKKARFRPRFVDGVATDTQGMLIKIPALN